MGRSQSKAACLLRLENLLYNYPDGLKIDEIAGRLGIQRRTAYRYLSALEEAQKPVWGEKGHYGLDRASYLTPVNLNLYESMALFFAARLLSRHSDENNLHVVSALEKLAGALPDATIARYIADTAQAVRQKGQHNPAFLRHLELLTRAWADRKQVEIQYRSSTGKESRRIVCIYFLEVTGIGYSTYAIGLDSLSGEIRIFKVERIDQARVLSEGYEIPPDFDPQTRLAAGWGIMWGDEITEVRLCFSPAVARRVGESVWHHSQEIEATPDGGCILSVSISNIMEIKPWIRSWGADVEVLAPPELRAEMAAEAREMAGVYGKEEVD
ncbi:MAG: transcriptional regulator [Firmicutes bacterium]|nr:transcriptional regulator [Bacillota bacterium]